MSSCPPLEVLVRFGSGSPEGSTDRALDAHIDGCRRCQEVLDGLAGVGSSGAGRVEVDPENLPRIPGFTMERELGRGGMGVVFLARELHPDRQVAVKFLSIGPFAAPRDRGRWLKEARAAARVRHPHIVQLYRVDEAGGWPYLVLEYLPGGSLKERLTGPLSPRDAATLLVPVARALEQLHLAGVSHLDLKPANILIDAPPGTPLDRAALKLADFGIARTSDDAATTGTGAAQGTLLYMAPEQLGGRRSALGPATDIHAMGVILYELLTGRPPFLADSGAETIRRIQTEEPVPPRRLNLRIPRDLEVLCLACLEKDPRRRQPSAGALADDLGRWLEGRPISARRVALAERGWRLCRRRPVVSALVATLAMTLAISFLVVLLLWRDAERARHRAQADYEVGRTALAEILDLGERSIEPTVVVSRDRFITSLDSTRTRIPRARSEATGRPRGLEDAGRRGPVPRPEPRVPGSASRRRSVYSESLRYWDRIIARDPGPIAPKYRRWQTLQCLGRILEQQGKPDEGLPFWEHAVAAGESLLPLLSRPDFNTMDVCRMALARSLERRGDHRRARGLLVANVAMLRDVPPDARIPFQVEELRRAWEDLLRTCAGNPRPRPERSGRVAPRSLSRRAPRPTRGMRRSSARRDTGCNADTRTSPRRSATRAISMNPGGRSIDY